MPHLLVFLSGFAGLVYEVSWMQQMGLLFGSTSHAAAATLAAFFAGLAAGSWFWGGRAAADGDPLRLYGWLEAGIAASAAVCFGLLHACRAAYPTIYQAVGPGPWLDAANIAIAAAVVMPPAFFMGGTIPAMGQHVVRDRATLGTTAALLYGVNTLGAALGAYAAGFHLPLTLGFRGTRILAIAVSATVAAVALLLPRQAEAAGAPPQDRQPKPVVPAAPGPRRRHRRGDAPRRRPAPAAEPPALGPAATTTLAFLSGFGALALQVLWTRMFSQVLENSVYTFAAILVIVLLCLAGGAGASGRLARLELPPAATLTAVLLAGGLAVAVTPFVFVWLTDSMRIVASSGSWPAYVALVFRTGLLAIGLPAMLLGILFPYLLKMEERFAAPPGASLGRLSAFNTAGAIAGSLAGGFVMLGAFGMWRSMQLVALLFLAAGLAVAVHAGRLRGAAAVALLVAVGLLDPGRLPITSTDPGALPKQVVETWEGSDCTVSVTRDPFGLGIDINSHYGLGSTGARMQEQLQADIPLMIYPETRSIFFLGLGTGITAGSGLDRRFPAVSRVVACELVPEVVTAARTYMTNVDGIDFTGGLFTDPRADVLVADGRHHLAAARDRYDMINADLFVPYRCGAGSLYAREHFETVKARLEPGGVFFQWLPLYQLTETEFAIIANTMLAVFDRVSLWRSTFQPGEDVVALAGHVGDGPLPAVAGDGTEARRQAIAGADHNDLDRLMLPFDPGTMPFFYCGNLTAARDLFASARINTDDMPLIEYLAPRSYRGVRGGGTPWFVGPRLADLVDAVLARCPPDGDPLLANRSAGERLLPLAAAAFHRARLAQAAGDEAACRAAWERFTAAWAPQRVGAD